MLFKKSFLFKIVLFKFFSLKIMLFKNARKTQKLQVLRGKPNQNVIFCVQVFFTVVLFKNIFFFKVVLFNNNFFFKIVLFKNIFFLQKHAL